MTAALMEAINRLNDVANRIASGDAGERRLAV
jgi:hypothetical protein